MLSILQQSWFFYRAKYWLILPAIVVFSLLRWWLTPDWLLASHGGSEATILTLEQLLSEIDAQGLIAFVLVTEVLSMLYFVCLFQRIVDSPELSMSQTLISATIRLIPATISFVLIALLMAAVSVAFLFLGEQLGVSQAMGLVLIGFFTYLSFRLALAPQIIAESSKFHIIFAIRESFRLTHGRTILHILQVFIFTILSLSAMTAVLSIIGDSSNPWKLLLEAIFQVHIQAFYVLLFYRIYLDARENGSKEKIIP